MRWVQVSYSIRFNWGSRQGGPRVSRLLQGADPAGGATGGEVARYLHLNPVRIAGLGLGKSVRHRLAEMVRALSVLGYAPAVQGVKRSGAATGTDAERKRFVSDLRRHLSLIKT